MRTARLLLCVSLLWQPASSWLRAWPGGRVVPRCGPAASCSGALAARSWAVHCRHAARSLAVPSTAVAQCPLPGLRPTRGVALRTAADGVSELPGDTEEGSRDGSRFSDREEGTGNYDGRRRDVMSVSPEFTALCQAQFEVLASMLGASRCSLFFRREDPRTGRLEFVPAAVYPEKQRVWVVGEGPSGLPATGAIELAGFIPATSLLPEYPFVQTQREGGQSSAVEIEDGGLSVPLEYGSVVLGMLAIWRDGGQEWTEAERAQVQAIATSLSLAVVLDQKHQWQEAVQAESLRKMLSETLHQVKNSLSAVRMFGKLLLRRLPGNDKMNRELAKDILIQSDRLVDLLLPIDSMARQPSLNQRAFATPPFLLQGAADRAVGDTRVIEEMEGAAITSGQEESAESEAVKAMVPEIEEDETLQEAVRALQMAKDQDGLAGEMLGGAGQAEKLIACRVEEALEPIISAGQAIAEFDGVHFNCLIAPQLPVVHADTRVLQEAVSNILDNALKYVLVRGDDPSGPAVTLAIKPCRAPLQGVEISIQDNGVGVEEDELPKLCDEGFRGRRCAHVPGTGLGLHIAQQLLQLLDGVLLVEHVSKGSGLRVRIQLREANSHRGTSLD